MSHDMTTKTISKDRLSNYMSNASFQTFLLYSQTRSPSFLRYLIELTIQSLLSWISGFPGIIARKLAYKPLLAKDSHAPFSEKDVELFSMNSMAFGRSVYIDSSCRIHASVAEISIGDNSRLMRNSYLCSYVSNARKGEGIYIGSQCWIGINAVIASGQGGIIIGDHVLIAPNVTIVTGSHGYENIDISTIEQDYSGKPIHIGDNVWIGANAVIIGGVSIGEHAVVAAGSVVNKNVDSYTVVGGVPAQVIRKLENSMAD